MEDIWQHTKNKGLPTTGAPYCVVVMMLGGLLAVFQLAVAIDGGAAIFALLSDVELVYAGDETVGLRGDSRPGFIALFSRESDRVGQRGVVDLNILFLLATGENERGCDCAKRQKLFIHIQRKD